MTYVDDIFIKDLKEVMQEEWEVDNRASWKDGSEIATKRIIQVSHKYDLSKGFPILTLRNINWKASIDEMLWIYSKMSNNIKDLNSSIWKQWADSEGNVQKAYGYQIGKPTMGHESQMHYVFNEIKTNPTSRRIQMNMFNAEDQLTKSLKSLIECAFGVKISVKNGKLHMTVDQRSGDKLTAAGAGSWNVVGYAFLAHSIAQECGLEAGILKHDLQDLHIYNKHIKQAEELINRHSNSENYELPTIKIANKPFFELTSDDIELIGYENQGKIEKLDIAI